MTCKTIMACSQSVLSLIYALSVLVTLSPAYPKVSTASQGTQVKDSAPNVYNTYNTFCTGLSKKIEVLLHDVKNELSEMREEIKSLKENNTTSQGNLFIYYYYFPTIKITQALHYTKMWRGDLRKPQSLYVISCLRAENHHLNLQRNQEF